MSRRSVVRDTTLLPQHHERKDQRQKMYQYHNHLCQEDDKLQKHSPMHVRLRNKFHRYRRGSSPSKVAGSAFIFFLMIYRILGRRNGSYDFLPPRIVSVTLELDQVSTDFALGHFRKIRVDPSTLEGQGALENSKIYRHNMRDPLWEDDCTPMHAWQETSFPSCNKMHEMHMESQVRFLADGGYNSVFEHTDMDGQKHIVKILQYETDVSPTGCVCGPIFYRMQSDTVFVGCSTRIETLTGFVVIP